MPLLELLENWRNTSFTRFASVAGGTGGVRFTSVARIKRKS